MGNCRRNNIITNNNGTNTWLIMENALWILIMVTVLVAIIQMDIRMVNTIIETRNGNTCCSWHSLSHHLQYVRRQQDLCKAMAPRGGQATWNMYMNFKVKQKNGPARICNCERTPPTIYPIANLNNVKLKTCLTLGAEYYRLRSSRTDGRSLNTSVDFNMHGASP